MARFVAEREGSSRRFAELCVEQRVQDALKFYVAAISSKNR